MKKIKWIQMGKSDDWGSVYYAPKSKMHSDMGMASTKRGMKLKPGKIPVKFKNGKVVTVTLTSRQHTENVSEQGSMDGYDVTSNIWGFNLSVYGQKTWIDLSDVSIKQGQFEEGDYS